MQLKRNRLQQKFGDAAVGYDHVAQFQHGETMRVLDAALMLLPEAGTLLDVGCGTGYFAQAATTLRPDWKILGLDIAYGMCAVANTRCTTLNADAQCLPLPDASVDGAVSSLCYQWVEHPRAAYAELARVLKPHGRAIIATLGQRSLEELRESATKASLTLGMLSMHGFETNGEALDAAGFDITMQEKRIETRHYASVASLLNSMRAIGAGNNFVNPQRGLMSPKRWAAMVEAYESLRTVDGIPATWEHHFFVVSKRA